MTAVLSSTRRRVAVALLAATSLAAVGVTAYADQLVNTLDSSIDPTRETLNLNQGGSAGVVGLFVDQLNGDGKPGCNLQSNDEYVTFSVTSSNTAVATVSPTSVTVDNCGDRPSVTVTPQGAGSADVTFAVVTNASSGGWNAAPANFTVDVGAQQSSNNPPTVSTAAADANGTEGDTLTTSGAFADQDNDTLTITKLSGAGTVTPSQSTPGAWSWSLGTNDDTSGTVVVQADDGKGGTVTDTFDYSAVNGDPAITGLAAGGSNCSPSVSFGWTDPGSADTHTASLDWGDGSAADTFGDATTSTWVTSVSNATHSYAAAGNYTITAGATDDDGGSGSDTLSYTVFNLPSAVLQPINATGSRSVFKLGSTVPVKLTVADCGGAPVGTLLPVVSMTKLDSDPNDPNTVVETPYTATPTNGKNMRYDAVDQQYIYNLTTKPLSAGTWRVSITDASFAQPVTAVFNIKK